jgi:ketosteroid isomerase-like protein
MSGSDADALRKENYALYERMRSAQNARDGEAFLSCFSDDIVFEAPAYSKGGEPIAVGRDAMGRMFNSLTEIFSSLNYEIKRFIPAVDPDLVIVEVHGNNEVASNKNRYRNNYIFLVTCRNRKIVHILEYSNPSVYSNAVNMS